MLLLPPFEQHESSSCLRTVADEAKHHLVHQPKLTFLIVVLAAATIWAFIGLPIQIKELVDDTKITSYVVNDPYLTCTSGRGCKALTWVQYGTHNHSTCELELCKRDTKLEVETCIGNAYKVGTTVQMYAQTCSVSNDSWIYIFGYVMILFCVTAATVVGCVMLWARCLEIDTQE